MELGLMEHVGASARVGVTVHVRATELLNPPVETTFTVEEDGMPGLTVPGVSAEAVSEKFCAPKLNVANISWDEDSCKQR